MSDKNFVLGEEKRGRIVYSTLDGFYTMDIDEFVQQSAEGILYDLNRSKEVTLSFLQDKRWINDYAVALVIIKLKESYDELQRIKSKL